MSAQGTRARRQGVLGGDGGRSIQGRFERRRWMSVGLVMITQVHGPETHSSS